MKVGIFQNYIDGRWVDAVSGNTNTIANPCDGEVVTQVARSSAEDIDLAVAAARRAFERKIGHSTLVSGPGYCRNGRT